ncbi:ABC transporter permease [Adhaeribacter sp. BT258]|uniref:ABC transporter permease n=1 Tax=Adhaeribacter terrigena TaxID=2793070 RepID=A0ABS1C4E9_9BACT|nr:FtsX-like permease family protein [Adhaeribacter terrigena]MBK0404235.1 ABC transporter permease [Adhaeribacter terrigena]
MNVSFLIAKRYFRSKKKRNIISIISNISMIGVAVGTMALIIVLSVFNGIEDLIRSLYGSFDPDLKITAVEGKNFEVTPEFLKNISGIKGVDLVSETVEDNALLRYQDRQMIVKLKGVSDNYFLQNGIDSSLTEGNANLKKGGLHYALLGRGVQVQLSVRTDNPFVGLQVLYPKASKKVSLNPENAFNEKSIMPAGVFAIERQYDDNYVFVPLEFARDLFSYGEKRSALEVKVTEGTNPDKVKRQLKKLLGPKFQVQNSDEQHTSLLRAVKVEKLFVFITFAFILLIASLNIFFSLSMLVIDKKKDIAILASMGASSTTIRNIFLFEGAIVALSGAGAGLFIGMIICWAQQTFGLISMGMTTAVVDSYPVKMQLLDFVFTGVAIIAITLIVSIRPARRAAALQIKDNL